METGRNRTETVRFPKRIGMIVPSSNTVVEPICSRIFFGMEDVVTVHYSRLEVVNVSLDDNSTRQFAVDTMLRAADQLAQAKVDAIIWNGTAGSWLGIERDREMCQKIEEKKYTKWMDYDKIEKNPYIRTRRTGDYMVINAQGNTKKLNRCMIDEKIPKEKREKILLLAEGSHVLWVVGFRISEYYKIEEHTENILQVTCDGGKDYGR